MTVHFYIFHKDHCGEVYLDRCVDLPDLPLNKRTSFHHTRHTSVPLLYRGYRQYYSSYTLVCSNPESCKI